MPAVTFLEPGTDATQDLTFFPNTFQGVAATAASASDQAYTGTRSGKVVLATNDAAALGTGPSVMGAAGGCASFRIRLSAVAPATRTILFEMYTNSGVTTLFGLGIDTNSTLRATASNSAAANGATVLAANTWYRITVSCSITSITVWSFKIYINGVLELTYTNASGTMNATGAAIILFGSDTSNEVSFPNCSAFTIWYDDLYVDDRTDQTDCGDIRATAKRPFANGTTNGFAGTGTPSGYGSGNARYVNERPLNQSNFVSVVAVASAITEEDNIESLSAGDIDLTGATIVGVEGWVQAKALVSETGKIIVDGTQSNIALTSTITLFTQNSATPTAYPAGTGTDIGIVTATTATTITWYEGGILIAYTPAVGGGSATVAPPALLSMGVQ